VQTSRTSQTNTPSWGLDRVAETQINLDGIYPYLTSAGAGTVSYIVDTGIYTQHSDFGGRAIWGANYADDEDTDCNGHGTHVAGTTGGTQYGVGKKTTLIAVKVLNCAGSGTNAGVISGVSWVVTDQKARKKPSVANMSLGGGLSTALNQAVAAAVTAGISFAVAAGNSNTNACTSSPASEPLAITVGATDIGGTTVQEDIRSYFSNYGTCVDIFAPGSDITSAWIGSTTARNTISGTSMASPHVAGAVALLLGADPDLTPAEISAKLSSTATTNLIDLECGGITVCTKSPNKLLRTDC